MSGIKYHNKGKIEEHRPEIQEILCTLNAQSSSFDENLKVDGCAPPLSACTHPQESATTSVAESGTYLAPPPPILCEIPIDSRFYLHSQLQHFSLCTFDQTHIRPA